MNRLVAIGIVLMILGGVLLVVGSYTTTEKHEANIFGAELSVTEKDKKPIPKALSFTLLGVGAIVTVIGATKSRKS